MPTQRGFEPKTPVKIYGRFADYELILKRKNAQLFELAQPPLSRRPIQPFGRLQIRDLAMQVPMVIAKTAPEGAPENQQADPRLLIYNTIDRTVESLTFDVIGENITDWLVEDVWNQYQVDLR